MRYFPQMDDEDEGFVADEDLELAAAKQRLPLSDADSLSPASDGAASPFAAALQSGQSAVAAAAESPSADADGGILEDGCGFEEEAEDDAKVWIRFMPLRLREDISIPSTDLLTTELI